MTGDSVEQIGMFGTEPKARASDPETSHEAARRAGVRLRDSQIRVLRTLAGGPMTDEEMQAALTNPMSMSGSRTRRKELVRQGFVRDTGKTRMTSLGNASIVWEVTEAGRACLQTVEHVIDTDRLLQRCRMFWQGQSVHRPSWLEIVSGLAQEIALRRASEDRIGTALALDYGEFHSIRDYRDAVAERLRGQSG